MRRVRQEPPELVVVVLWLPFSCSELPLAPPELVVVVGDVLPLSLVVVCGEPPPLLVVWGSVLVLEVCGEPLAVLVVCGGVAPFALCEELLPAPVGVVLAGWPGLWEGLCAEVWGSVGGT
jgi:hypothetical protein